jgi:hypothetical protein
VPCELQTSELLEGKKLQVNCSQLFDEYPELQEHTLYSIHFPFPEQVLEFTKDIELQVVISQLLPDQPKLQLPFFKN